MSWVSASMDSYGESLCLGSSLTVTGHVIGLLHEHQRPDAGSFVKFDCRALIPYDEARSLVQSTPTEDEPAFTTRMSGQPPEKSAARRWWSVPEEHETQPEDNRPWPPGDDGLRTITYCFENQRSYDFLWTTFVEALVKWEPAIQVSALAFAYDPACTEQLCLCSAPGIAEATLHIILGEAEQAAYGTLGYTDRIVEKSAPNMPRHYLQCSHAPGLIWGTSATVIMAHELGKRLKTRTSR